MMKQFNKRNEAYFLYKDLIGYRKYFMVHKFSCKMFCALSNLAYKLSQNAVKHKLNIRKSIM